jgi:hypothetical protein
MTDDLTVSYRRWPPDDPKVPLLQPREGTDGEQRDDLSLDDATLGYRRQVVALAGRLWSMTLSAHGTPDGRDMMERMSHPRPGDFVVENTRTDPHMGIGYLVCHRIEWAMTDEEWEQIEREDPGCYAGERPTDEVWYVQYGPNPDDICRWANAEFIAVPRSRFGTF